MRHLRSFSFSATIGTFVDRIRRKLTTHGRLDAPGAGACFASLQETSQRLLNNPKGPALQEEMPDWAAGTGRANETSQDEPAGVSAHRELWDRLEILILNALEQRTSDRNH